MAAGDEGASNKQEPQGYLRPDSVVGCDRMVGRIYQKDAHARLPGSAALQEDTRPMPRLKAARYRTRRHHRGQAAASRFKTIQTAREYNHAACLFEATSGFFREERALSEAPADRAFRGAG